MTEYNEQDNTEASTSGEETPSGLDIATGIVEGLINIAENQQGIISLINVTYSADGAAVASRKNFSFISTLDNVFETGDTDASFVNFEGMIQAFAEALVSPDESTVTTVLYALFDYQNIAANNLPGETASAVPSVVYKWELKDGTIVPDETSNITWGEVETTPGLEFVVEDEAITSEEDFELPDTELTAHLIRSMVMNAPDGNHVITALMYPKEGEEQVASFPFSKSGEEVVMDETSGALFVIGISSALAEGSDVGITLRSYIERSLSDGFEPDETAVQEVRSWHVAGPGVRALTAEEAIAVHCVDEETGKPVAPAQNITYCDAWF